MTGIERLVDMVNDGPYSGGMIHISVQKLREICEQIEREADDISGHESEVLAFVEEKGGLTELERRLMPEGMVWPRFEDGELVGFGDEYVNAKGNVSTLRTIVIKDCRDRLGGGYYWKLGKGACAVVVKNGERIKRPPVLAADGEPLESGQTVWDKNGNELVVGAIEDGGHTVTCRYADVGDGIPVHGMWSPSDLIHQRPVLDADGVPIKKGDTVYWLEHIVAFTVVSPHETHDNDGHELKCGHTVEIAREGHEPHMYVHPESLHHTKPEPPDSVERIADDIMRMVDEWCSYPTLWEASEKAARSVGEATMGLALRSLSKRCRAMAERERGE